VERNDGGGTLRKLAEKFKTKRERERRAAAASRCQGQPANKQRQVSKSKSSSSNIKRHSSRSSNCYKLREGYASKVTQQAFICLWVKFLLLVGELDCYLSVVKYSVARWLLVGVLLSSALLLAASCSMDGR
ncbi:hypothetical protein LINGRAHAP2_LOCUS3888, partial [Linum grandiflorum]